MGALVLLGKGSHIAQEWDYSHRVGGRITADVEKDVQQDMHVCSQHVVQISTCNFFK